MDYHYGVRFDLTFDTQLAAHIIDENELHGLKYQARNVFNAEDWDIDLASKKGETQDKNTLSLYGAGDAYWTRRLARHLNSKLKEDPTQESLYRNLVMPVARVYEKIEKNGVYVNTKNMEIVGKKLRKSRKISRKKLDRIAKGLGHESVNWNSSQQVGNILFDTLGLIPQGFTDGGEPSSGADYLGRMKDDHEIIQHLLDYRGAEKMISSFVEGWAKRMVDGNWLHPSFKVSGTVTGRPSCSNPNFQQTPRRKDIRSLIGAPEGWTFFQLDYSQLELRIAAIISGCEEMLAVFRDGGDIHTATASAVSGVPYDQVTPDERKKAKAVNFGFIYGMGWKKFKDYALDKYGVLVTDSEAKTFRKRYFERYPGLKPWHERQKRIVHSLGQVRTLTGRIRHLSEIYSPDTGLVAQAERNAINSPIQGFGGEMTLMALVDMDKEFNICGEELQLCGTVHDAIVGRVRNDRAGEILPRLKVIMENPSLLDTFDIELPIDLVVDLDVGNWGNGVPLEEFLQAA
jgi:DNA polymerase I-like protein with 3'-5' exonuclease and polymerase domains